MSSLLNLIKAIELLSNPYEEQLKYLDKIGIIGDNVDEIALEFDDAFRTVKFLIENAEISKDACLKIIDIDRILSIMSESDTDFWTKKSLKECQLWSDLRKISQECLEIMRNYTNNSK